MVLYFCLNDLLDQIESAHGKQKGQVPLILIYDKTDDLLLLKEDIFSLQSMPRLLDLDDLDNRSRQLAMLMDDVPQYLEKMQLSLEAIEKETAKNNDLYDAWRVLVPRMQKDLDVDLALSNGPPSTKWQGLSAANIAEIYLALTDILGPKGAPHRLELAMLGRREKPFINYFDGYVQQGLGYLKADLLLAFGMRTDHIPGKPPDHFIRQGHQKAEACGAEDLQELLWVWFEADDYQGRRANDIARVLNISFLPRQPNWMRYDVMNILEKEIMKQGVARMILAHKDMASQDNLSDDMKTSLKSLAEGNMSEPVEQLCQAILERRRGGADHARQIAQQASLRQKEARRLGLV